MKRSEQLAGLQSGQVFDLLVIGGGATGCGIALDAASRGLKAALVEQNDFAEGTSGRSTKLVHGGVRYLELAIKHFDRVQYHLVRDGLRERGRLLRNASHLARRLPLVTPLYRWWQVPYVYAGLRLYDLLAGRQGLGRSRLLGRRQALERFPLLKAEGLKAGVLYYDGQFNDARLALTLALSAAEQGAVVANQLRVLGLLRQDGRLAGAELADQLTGERWRLRARGVINATGPFVDRVRRLDDPACAPILKLSSGIHLVLDRRFLPPDAGLMIPATEDGRILFVLPWEGHALVGTTDEPAELSEHPRPQQAEIDYLLRHLGRYFNLQLGREHILAAWSGLRPLVADPKAADTARLARDHVIQFSPSGLLTIAGGKWTTYRKMAEDAVDQAVRAFGLAAAGPCRTAELRLAGGENVRPQAAAQLAAEVSLPPDVVAHLLRAYGDRADKVARLAVAEGAARLHPQHPYLEAEVVFAARCELAERSIDLLARRLPLALVDRQAALDALPRVNELLAAAGGWDRPRRQGDLAEAETLLRQGF